MLPVLRLGPFVVASGMAALFASLWLGMESAEREGKRLGFANGQVSTTLGIALIVGIIGARLAHVARYWSSYQPDWTQAVALTSSALDPVAGAAFGLLAAIIYLQRKQVNVPRFLDALAPALALVGAVWSLGNLFSGDGYGAPAVNLPWAIELWGERRHPTQIYELVAALSVFAVAWGVRVRARLPFDGFLFLAVAAMLAGARLFLEAFRGDSTATLAGLRDAQLLSLAVLLGALWLLARRLKTAGLSALKEETMSP